VTSKIYKCINFALDNNLKALLHFFTDIESASFRRVISSLPFDVLQHCLFITHTAALFPDHTLQHRLFEQFDIHLKWLVCQLPSRFKHTHPLAICGMDIILQNQY